jgi:hypothetical protein
MEKKIITYEKEKKTYMGIDYLLKLIGYEGEEYNNWEDVNPRLWCVLEFCKKDEKLVKSAYQNFLWYDTRVMTSARIKDKYHQCELVAVSQINYLLGSNFFKRIKYILSLIKNEMKWFFYCERKIFTRRLKYFWVKKIKGNKLDNIFQK